MILKNPMTIVDRKTFLKYKNSGLSAERKENTIIEYLKFDSVEAKVTILGYSVLNRDLHLINRRVWHLDISTHPVKVKTLPVEKKDFKLVTSIAILTIILTILEAFNKGDNSGSE